MRISLKNTAIILLASLGVVACGSSGGGSSAPASNASSDQSAKIQALEAQVQAQQQAVEKAEESANQANTSLTAAKNDLATATSNLAASEKAVETAKVQLQAEQAKTASETAAKEAAQKALAVAQADLTSAKQALTEAQQAEATAKAQLASELASAKQQLTAAQEAENQAKTALSSETAAKEEALANLTQAQKEKEEALNKIAALEAELAPYRAEVEAKQLQAEETAKKWAFLTQDDAWRHIGPKWYNGYAEHYSDNGKWYLYPSDSSKLSLQEGVNFADKPISDDVQTVAVNATHQTLSGDTQELHVADGHFVNQVYSTYLNWTLTDNVSYNDMGRMASYVALPTERTSSYIQEKGTATYNGKALGINNYTDDKNLYVGDFTLTADFGKETVSGAITHLNNQNYQLQEGKINVSDSGNAIFSGKTDGNLDYSGVFAGPQAEEVVGRVGTDISFGGKR